MVTPSASASAQCQLRLQLEKSKSSEDLESSSSSSHNASCFGFSQLSPAKLGLLAALLLLTIAASWPAGTSAAPRIARGAHLIFPHKSKTSTEAPVTPPPTRPATLAARIHRRHKLRRHHKVLREAAASPECGLRMPQFQGLKSCSAMELKPYDSAEIGKALHTAQSYKETVICLTEDWLQQFFNGTNIVTEAKRFSFFELNLEHPLKDQVKKVLLTEEGKFEYQEEVGSLEEEMPKIIETLLVLEKLVNTTKYDKNHLECTFVYIKDAIQSNIASAMALVKEHQCNAKPEICHNKPIRLPFFIAMEAIKVLTILEHTYEQVLQANQ